MTPRPGEDERELPEDRKYLPRHVRVALDQIEHLAKAAYDVDAKGDVGPEALYWLAKIFPPPRVEHLDSRSSWLSLLAWLESSMAFPSIRELRNAVADLDRGIVREGLQKTKGAGQGRRKSKSDAAMALLQVVIEAADEIGRRFPPAERDDLIAVDAEVSLDALRRWRQMLAEGPPRFRPGTTWLLSYGDADPVTVLKDAARKYSDAE